MTGKLAEMILYIAQQSASDPYFGATKLNKILFLADFSAYASWGKSISGAIYRRLQFGPAPYHLLPAQGELERDGRVRIEEVGFFNQKQKRVIPLDEPNLSIFNQMELAMLNHSIEQCRNLSGSDLSEWTHTLLPWLLAGDKEEIPYNTVFVLRKRSVSKESLEWGRGKVVELGLA